ncbi:hypothetical protein [Thiocapsa sp. N5-Cardenillas]|uniref:hypothetical protein n=1 Tax=Thiocapsa sp. N5-Cardenillas TaxID=3137397 RepID=UPI0035B39A76
MSTTIAEPLGLDYGITPEVEDGTGAIELTPETQFAIADPAQAFAVATRLKQDWEKGISNQAVITAQLNGQRPRDPAILENLGRSWMPNINTGLLRIWCNSVAPRLWQPINTATTLTAAKLPEHWPNGIALTGMFRQKVTETIRGWRKWPWFVRQLTREVAIFGFGYAVHFDEYDWHPTFIRQDRGFIPGGFSVLDEELPLFAVWYDYQPFELLGFIREQRKRQTQGWNEPAVKRALKGAGPKSPDIDDERTYEEMVRQASIGWNYEKGFNVIKTVHLFSLDPDGSVSHHILLESDCQPVPQASNVDYNPESYFLFERRSQFKSMRDVVTIVSFDPDDGTIHGSWGAGQMLFDLAIEAEKAQNDALAGWKQASKVKTQTPDGKSADEVRLHVDDQMIVVEGATFAGNTAALSKDPKADEAIIDRFSAIARERVGSLIPPIPTQPSDIKAAQINAKMLEQREIQNQQYQVFLWQFGGVIDNIVRRLFRTDTINPEAKKLRKELLTKMEAKELEILIEQNQIESLMEFTQQASQARAAFAAAKGGNPYYNQKTLEIIQAESVGGRSFAEAILMPGDDSALERKQRWWQQQENTTMLVQVQPVQVQPDDQDWFHMLELRPVLEKITMDGQASIAFVMVQHYSSHYVAGTVKGIIPKGRINAEKAFVAKVNRALETGQLPPEGFEDDIDLMDQAQAQMGSAPVVTEGPREEEQIPAEAMEMAE